LNKISAGSFVFKSYTVGNSLNRSLEAGSMNITLQLSNLKSFGNTFISWTHRLKYLRSARKLLTEKG